ncbi:MAG: electron transport complex subunit RsxC [Victivallaceae bacterium]|nr:electron transport complex subunit RsxC [Victivallaceae bacterium]
MKESLFTFKGGIHPQNDGKELSRNAAIKPAPLLERYFVTISQNAGKPPKPVVAPGDLVKKYQLIAAADGFVSANLHAPTSGKVKGIVEVPGAMGLAVPAIEIEADGCDETVEPLPLLDWQNLDAKTLLDRIAACGVVGMGGAAFPSHVKLSPPPDAKIDTVILNGAECEPYLTADHRLMLEHPTDVLEGAAIIGHILGVKKVVIAVEVNKPDAIKTLSDSAQKYGVEIAPLKVQYPQGSEKQLIMAISGRQVPSGGLPMHAGCVVQNVGTAAAIRAAVIDGRPLIERVTTVTGEVVKHPGNWLLRIGTPVIEAVKLAGGVTAEPGKLILGGPMMGFAEKSFKVPVAKNTSGILLLPHETAVNYESGNCLRCGRCVEGCPMKLAPALLCTAIEGGRYDLAADNHVMDCLECGSCSYNCPAHRPIVQYIRRAKAEIRKKAKR